MKNFIVASLVLLTSLTSCTPQTCCDDTTVESRGNLNCQKLSPIEARDTWNLPEKACQSSIDNNECYVQINTSDFEPGSKHTLYNVNMMNQKNKMYDLVANEKGELCTMREGVNSKNICLSLCGFMNGEKQGYQIVSENGAVYNNSFSPRPLSYTWKDGASVAALLNDTDASSFTITFKGFQPNESFKTITENGEETKNADENGELIVQLVPLTNGKAGGSGKYTIERKDETGFLNYNWGNQAKK